MTTVYLDSSVILRVLLGEEHPLAEWEQILFAVVNPIVRVECLRTLDRLRVTRRLEPGQIKQLKQSLDVILSRCELMPLSDTILAQASRPLPVVVASLDAIHLASACAYAERISLDIPPIAIATHDRALSATARALDVDVLGV
jgi:predicted nucleic acid-binding protein